MNPEELKKQAEEETGDAVVKPDPGGEVLEEVVPPPCGDGCEGCPACTTPEYESEETPPETEQPKEERPEFKQVSPDEDPQQEEILQGLQIELTSTGEVKRNFYGTSQNVTLMLGLSKILEMEIEQRQKLQRGFMPSAELTAMGGLARLMQNISAVLIQVQGTMSMMNETMKVGFDEARQVESTVDAESKQE
ncbi:MAG: hypothetical protein GQ553_04965 [Nitrosomonadaceae bacterium]|nr:hypothetical protein [Nitrosomonadaceae bacterium]